MDFQKRCYTKFSNKACEYFPCHSSVSEESFNCLFCYCPLYVLGKDCGGAYRYTEDGIKDCSDCTFPHHAGNYDAMIDRLASLQKIMKKTD